MTLYGSQVYDITIRYLSILQDDCHSRSGGHLPSVYMKSSWHTAKLMGLFYLPQERHGLQTQTCFSVALCRLLC